MRKHYPLNSNGAEDAGQLPWTDGVPSTGTQGSYPGHAIVTDTEAEILSAIDAAGLVRNGSDLTQFAQAMSRGIYLGGFTGSANALSAALPNLITIPTLLRGMRFSGNVSASNTGAVTVALAGFGQNPGTLPLLGKNGAALQAGDLPVGADFDFRYDGSALRLVSSAASEQAATIINTVLPYTVAGSTDSTVFAPGQFLSDIPAVGSYVVVQTLNVSNVSYLDASASVAFRNDTGTVVNVTAQLQLFNLTASAPVGVGHYLGEVVRDSLQIPLTVAGKFRGLNKAHTYQLQIAVEKQMAITTAVLDGAIIATHD